MATPRAYAGIAGDERRAERRRRLVDAGYSLLADGGPAAITVTGVCREAGLTARYFYEHFPNRDALLAAIVDAEAETVIGLILGGALAAPDDPQLRGEAAVAALLDALEDDPRRARLSREQRHDEAVLRMQATIAERMTETFVANATIVWPGAADHPERVSLASSLTVGGVLQMVNDWIAGDAQLSRDELIRMGARFMVATGEVVLTPGGRMGG